LWGIAKNGEEMAKQMGPCPTGRGGMVLQTKKTHESKKNFGQPDFIEERHFLEWVGQGNEKSGVHWKTGGPKEKETAKPRWGNGVLEGYTDQVRAAGGSMASKEKNWKGPRIVRGEDAKKRKTNSPPGKTKRNVFSNGLWGRQKKKRKETEGW